MRHQVSNQVSLNKWFRHLKSEERKNREVESTAAFKHRIAIMMRERETGKKYSVIGAARPNECVVRKTKKQK